MTTPPRETALVTGATGFVGGHLARALVSRGYRVRVLARVPDRAAELRLVGIEVVEGDLRDRASLDRVMGGVGVAYHLAAVSRESGLPDAAYYAANVEGVRSLIEAAGAARVRRVVHCSTVDVHGDAAHPPANEDSPLQPGDIYQVTKLEGEQAAREVARRAGVDLVVARPSNIYGPRDRRLLWMFRRVVRGRWVTLGRGLATCHLTYVDDLVEGLRLCGEVSAAAGRTYILGGPELSTLNGLARLVAREAGVRAPWVHLPAWPFWLAGAACEAVCAPLRIEPPFCRKRVGFHTRSRAFDISRARNELGYNPQVGLREGVRRCLEWYKGRDWL